MFWNMNMAMFRLKHGIAGLTHYIHLIMPVSITVIIKTAEMIKVAI